MLDLPPPAEPRPWRRPSSYLVLALLLFLAIMPWLTNHINEPFYLDVATRVVIFALAATGLNLVLGYGGLISLGHAAYLLLGAYSVGILSLHDIYNGWWHLLAAIGSSALFAFITGAISLRTQGASFIMITLAFAQMLFFLFLSLEQFGGSDGLSLDVRSEFTGFDFEGSIIFYYLCFAVLVFSLYFSHRFNQSALGMAVIGARINPERMRHLGYRIERFQLTAYVFSGIFCGIAGFLLVNFTYFVSPEMMDWLRSAELIFMVILGGVATVTGPLVGATTFIVLEEWLSGLTVYWQLIFGLILIAVALFSKGGLVRLLDRFTGTRGS